MTDFCIDCSGDQDVTLPRSYWRENTNYNLAGNALAVKMYCKPTSSPVSVATGKVNCWIRGDIDYTLAGNAAASLIEFSLTDSGSSGTSALYGVIGGASISGPGTAKAIYGRGLLASGSTGVAVGLVGEHEMLDHVYVRDARMGDLYKAVRMLPAWEHAEDC